MRTRALLAPVLLVAFLMSDQVQALPPLGSETYHLDFSTPATPDDFSRVYPGLATWGYFGDEPLKLKPSRPSLTQAQRFTSRTWPGIQDVYVDSDYCPGATTPKVTSGLEIDTYRLERPADLAACGQGRRAWASAIVTSQPNPHGRSEKWAFAQAFGYFEVEARLPCDPGRWPAFWLLGTATGNKTEIDVFEHYGGTLTVQSGSPPRPYIINRVGQPFSSVHSASGPNGQMTTLTNARSLPSVTEADRSAFCKSAHKMGVYWTPKTITFYIDRRKTFSTDNPGITDSHYWVLNMDVSPSAGDPMLHPNPSAYMIYSVRVWALPLGEAAADKARLPGADP